MTRFTFTHSIQFKSGDETLPAHAGQYWKTVRGALRAAEAHAKGMERYYNEGSIAMHALVILDDQGQFVTNEAA